MKNLTKKLIAIVMTMLMVAALLPVTASAEQYAEIVVELNEPYYGENLNDLLPEIEMVTACDVIGGYLFTVYYAHTSDEDAYAAAAKLAENPLVKFATYCPGYPSAPTSRVMFEVFINRDYFGGYYGISDAELGKLFPDMKMVKVTKWNYMHYYLYFDVESLEEVDEIYSELRANPFLTSIYCYVGNMSEYVTNGRITVTTKGRYTPDEVVELLSDVGVREVYNSYGSFSFSLSLNDWTFKGTFDAVKKLMNNPEIVKEKHTEKLAGPAVMPQILSMDESAYLTPERPEVTVATALSALRIAAQLTEVRNDVYDYKLADAIWQYDCDGDKAITVSDALRLLRKAAKLA